MLVACSLHPAVFIPGELTTPAHLYVIHKGIALHLGRILTPGRSWGEDMILARQHLCHYSARAMSYLEVYRLSRSTLLDLARPFPIALRRIRWEAVRLAMMRTLVATKRAMQKHEEERRKEMAGADALCTTSTSMGSDTVSVGGNGGGSGNDSGRSGSSSNSSNSAKRAVWGAFMEQATDRTAGKTPWSPSTTQMADEVSADPSAVLEAPSLHDVSRGLMQVRAEVTELTQGMDEILRHIRGPGGTKPSKADDQMSAPVLRAAQPPGASVMTHLFA